MRIINTVALLFLLTTACVEEYNFKDTAPSGMLVVEGVVSDQYKRHQITLSRATSLDNKTFLKERGATVTITDESSQVITLSENTNGVYETPEFSARPGGVYTLNIQTADGSSYSSHAVPFTDGPGIANVYPKYIDNPNGEGKGIQVFADTEDQVDQTHYYRWNYIETYEIHAPFPSNWVWLGGNSVDWRYERFDTCFVTDTLRTILIRSTKGLDQGRITAQPIRYIADDSYIFRKRYSILVEQFCLSEQSYLYWENLRTISESQGTLSDIQPGSLTGNIVSHTDPGETVLGYFDVGKVSEKRILFSAIDFYGEGLKMPKPFRSNCFEIAPIQVHGSVLEVAMIEYERTMYIWEVAGMVPDAIFSLMPKSCCDCRDQGPTERPPFF